MALYEFKAITPAGGIETGRVEAKTKAEAYQSLISRKLRPVRIEVQDDAGGKTKAAGADSKPGDAPVQAVRRLSPAGVLLFTEELAELLDAGLQLDPALRVIENREEKSPLKGVSAHVRQQIREGITFSTALRNCNKSFSELYCNMVAAGEAAGALPKILRRQVQYLAMIAELQSRVMMALVYPSIVFVAGIALLIIFMTFLLPQLTGLLTRSGKTLPFMTQMVVNTSAFFASYWWVMLAVIIGVSLAFRGWVRRPEGRMTWDRVQLRIPLLGNVLRSRFFTQFLQTLSTLVTNGVALLNGLLLMQQATPNVFLKEVLGGLAAKVGEGMSLSRSMRQTGMFPAVLLDIIAVGEQTGDLGGALQRGATKYDKEFSNRIQQLTTLIQPLTIVVVAFFVGIVAYSMITGILTSVSGLRSPR